MTWTNRLRLIGGLIGVLALVAVLTIVFNQRQTQAQSLTATIGTDAYDVGAGYGGTVIEQDVRENDVVAVGDEPVRLLIVSHRQHRSETSPPEG